MRRVMQGYNAIVTTLNLTTVAQQNNAINDIIKAHTSAAIIL
jgi:Mg2+ and Co2+ transporter CorA